MKKLISALCVATAALTAPSHGAVINFGSTSSNGGDCTYTCTAHLQQEYDAAAFGSTVEISRISFFFNYLDQTNQTPWQVRLATNANGSGINSAFASNLGADKALFATGNGSVTVNNRVDFFGSFVYDPSAGNLMLDILGGGGVTGSFTATGDVNRVYSWGEETFGNVDLFYGISTEFEVAPVSSNDVPEPATLALFAVGMAGVAFSRRKKAAA
ncbi:PEP-CTERM sorting domain-containing protein [Pseudoduganella namucuonensis]|uniref:PEP-CTERM protein-sorting domain-containing protein n=1 Tax=Pseudoduganella namucuonensis TaxID=1035707 RepID=A0A1I7FR19_9BURK|nr:PEP-CTERM sorting domain-containing protein [Pseudoduganella namucuonensis]SFU38659.1 PEP-CTERM protein-sorting domain-containing protein [Pseudoduganella namucuonensis]